MDFEADWNLFCREPTTLEVARSRGASYSVGPASFKVVYIPGTEICMMETPVTQELYEAMMGENPSYFKDNQQNPVENLTWDEANTFCKAISVATKETFRLPTSEEWEFAALGGLSSFEDFSPKGDYAVFKAFSTSPVKSKLPNPFGLYDMIGNVYEWVSDSGGLWDKYYHGLFHRNLNDPGYRNIFIGFRCVVEL